MKFLLDESAEFRLAVFLRTLGHDVTAIAHDYPASLKDWQVLDIAVAEERIIITNDSDFGDLVFRQQHEHRGIIYFRVPKQSGVDEKMILLKSLLITHAKVLNQFLVVSRRGVRVRRTLAGS